MAVQDCDSNVGVPLPDAPITIQLDVGLICNILDINTGNCAFLDTLAQIIGLAILDALTGQARQRFASGGTELIVWRIAEKIYDAFGLTPRVPDPIERVSIDTNVFCRSRPLVQNLATPEQLKVALLGALLGDGDLLISYLTDLFWYENWFKYCKCATPVPTPDQPPPVPLIYIKCNGIIKSRSTENITEQVFDRGWTMEFLVNGWANELSTSDQANGLVQNLNQTYGSANEQCFLVYLSSEPPLWTINQLPGSFGTFFTIEGQEGINYTNGGSLSDFNTASAPYVQTQEHNGGTRILTTYLVPTPLSGLTTGSDGRPCSPLQGYCIHVSQENRAAFEINCPATWVSRGLTGTGVYFQDRSRVPLFKRTSKNYYLGVAQILFEFCVQKFKLTCEEAPLLCPCQLETGSAPIFSSCQEEFRTVEFWGDGCPIKRVEIQNPTPKCGETRSKIIEVREYDPTQLV
ncbi:MAG: hypothetical protein SFT94_05605 [Pseudanabaenaceae cyanobacterium bins.68]|nr:hypothetical protein [Pseudanabaenaceae cyanobacterium bins.68]